MPATAAAQTVVVVSSCWAEVAAEAWAVSFMAVKPYFEASSGWQLLRKRSKAV